MITEDVAPRILELTRRGESAASIAAILGVSCSTVTRVRRRGGGARLTPPPLTEQQLALALALLQDGAGYVEAARTIGCSDTTLADRYPGYALTHAEIAERRILNRRMNEIERSVR